MDFHKDLGPPFPLRQNAHIKWQEHLRELMKSGDNHVLVVLDNNHVIGFTISQIKNHGEMWEHDNFGFISDMAVKAEYRRKGIGEQMLTRINEWLESRYIDRIELDVISQNQVGYSFWKKHGFKNYIHHLYLDR